MLPSGSLRYPLMVDYSSRKTLELHDMDGGKEGVTVCLLLSWQSLWQYFHSADVAPPPAASIHWTPVTLTSPLVPVAMVGS